MRIKLFCRDGLIVLASIFLEWSCAHGTGAKTNLRTQEIKNAQSVREAANMKWNKYLIDMFKNSRSVVIFEINELNVSNVEWNELLLLNDNKAIQNLAAALELDEKRSGIIIECLAEANIKMELTMSNGDIVDLLVMTDSITPPDEGSLFFTEESKAKLREWFIKNIGRLPYGWDGDGCGE